MSTNKLPATPKYSNTIGNQQQQHLSRSASSNTLAAPTQTQTQTPTPITPLLPKSPDRQTQLQRNPSSGGLLQPVVHLSKSSSSTSVGSVQSPAICVSGGSDTHHMQTNNHYRLASSGSLPPRPNTTTNGSSSSNSSGTSSPLSQSQKAPVHRKPLPSIPQSASSNSLMGDDQGEQRASNTHNRPVPNPPTAKGGYEPQPPSATAHITVDLIPHDFGADTSSAHPSLDHLAAFTSLRDLKAKEILTTERTYCDNMRILAEVFLPPLKSGEVAIPTREEISKLCSNISHILSFSKELLERLEERLAAWSTTQRIGDVFKQLIPFLKIYTNYTVGYDNLMNVLLELEKSSSFVSFLQKCLDDPRTRKMDLRSYLIQPVQRITRYHMLLDELLKHTNPTHPDYLDLEKALAEMKKVTSEANEAIKRSEARAKVLEIQKLFVGDVDLVAPHRFFVYEGVLTKVCRKACKKRFVFLFSDMLVYGSSIPPKLLMHEKINLDHCRIEDIPDGDSGGSRSISLNGALITNAFQICSDKKSFIVFADNAESKMKWMLMLTQSIEAIQTKKSTLKSGPGSASKSEAPVWVPDETATNCPFCTESFTFMNRRHHCRNCGALVCGKCSEKKLKLPVTDYKPARVCDTCFEKANNNNGVVVNQSSSSTNNTSTTTTSSQQHPNNQRSSG
ncbi:hypothetical protein SAMD00019534_055130 [Acytostelium subglobosum LB1]|uniref:hypothetical protein n=1 Tax=Acytostelium subglobosum LB1 TaxID=1410327 RepID=UPI000644EAF1|nr:hypothetical protein SAMD00019534_055130 [Acytostelium subglobosum LB1]GAM22338.1 hypothetical protein SAMD00019534_055130 [Acytostelium subglobosum LB1]|eukprot:XP_012754458.1 hypothetical protein SAMD00019534_055130 [Acytostelium subglobosum LB1]